MVVEGPCFAEWPYDIPCDSVHESVCQIPEARYSVPQLEKINMTFFWKNAASFTILNDGALCFILLESL